MAHEKLYTAKQAAQSVLDKVSEILQKSEMTKAWSPEKGRKQHDALQAKRGESYGHEATGVHSPSYSSGKDRGQSMAGDQLRHAPSHKKPEGAAAAKQIHQKTLSDLKSMPKPNLPKSEEMGKGEHEHVYKCEGCGGQMSKAEPKGEINPKQPQAGEPEKVGARVQQQKDPQHNAKEDAEGNNELAGTTPTQVGQDGKNKPGFDEMKGHLKLAKFIGMKHYKRNKALTSAQSQSGAEAQHDATLKGN